MLVPVGPGSEAASSRMSASPAFDTEGRNGRVREREREMCMYVYAPKFACTCSCIRKSRPFMYISILKKHQVLG